MATVADIPPSHQKALYMRLQALLVDGGTSVLRNLIETKYPGKQWSNHLNQKHIRVQLKSIRNRKLITSEEFDKLYPERGPTDPTKYDVSLIVCLLRNVCGLDAQSAVWNGVPASMDHSVEADIRRLNIERNKLAHTSRAALSEPEFNKRWLNITEALLRLGTNIPDLKLNLDKLKEKSIDPEKERELENVIEIWEKLDKVLHEDLDELRSKVKEHDKDLDSLRKSTNQLQTSINENDAVQKSYTNNRVDEVKTIIDQTADDLKDLRKQQEKKQEQSTELNNLKYITKKFLEDSMADDVYVETRVHRAAKENLLANKVIILSGNPGEGKTTMAIKLMLEVSAVDKCLRLSQPSDWRLVDFKLFDTIFIDDIFGSGVLDENLVKGWDKYFPEMWKLLQKKVITVTITSRHYILDEARQMFHRSAVFRDEHIQFLSSEKLSVGEKTDILTSHFRSSNKAIENVESLIAEYVTNSASFLQTLSGRKPAFLFGFPECANMFVRNSELLEKGSIFFECPNEFFHKCVEDLRNDEEKFLALLVIWAQRDKVLFLDDLDMRTVPKKISEVLASYGYKLKGKLLKTLQKSLKHHENGFIQSSQSNSSRNGKNYRFSHNVIKDMIGLIISLDYPKVCLDFTDKDFFGEFITTNKERRGKFSFYVEECLHERLIKTCLRLSSNPSRTQNLIDQLFLKRGGWRPNSLQTNTRFDATTIYFHEMFSDSVFSSKFVAHLAENGIIEKYSSQKMMVMSGFFLSHGFKLDQIEVNLPTYLLFHTDGVLFKELLQHKNQLTWSEGEIGDDMYLALLIAAHKNKKDVVEALIRHGISVSEEAIYIAAINEHIEILEMLINAVGDKMVTKGEYENGNSALIVAAKKGLANSVRLLVKHSDLTMRNNDNVSALEKAVIHEFVDVVKILVNNGAPINEKSKKFQRTPLHMACDMGQAEMVDILLKAGARLDLKDHRGHYPIHCAAITGHNEIVTMLAEHDKRQVTWRIESYGKKSLICGMTVFHVAVWKNNVELMKALLEKSTECNVRDRYGRTPIYRTSFEDKIEIFKILLPHCNAKLPEKHGYTPLHAAIHKGHSEIVEMLIPLSDVNVQDKFGKTPLQTACQRGYCDIVEKLLECGADANMNTKRGHNAYSILIGNAKRRIVPDLNNESSKKPNVDFVFLPFIHIRQCCLL